MLGLVALLEVARTDYFPATPSGVRMLLSPWERPLVALGSKGRDESATVPRELFSGDPRYAFRVGPCSAVSGPFVFAQCMSEFRRGADAREARFGP